MTRARVTLRSLWTAAAVLIVMSGCSSTVPLVAPSPAQTTKKSPTIQRVLSGRVLDENGHPIANATFTADNWSDGSGYGPGSPVLTDSDGKYQAVVNVLPSTGEDAFTITANGFDETDNVEPFDMAHDFQLFRPVVLTPGADVHLHIDSNNSLCGNLSLGADDAWICRLIHVTAPVGTTVTLTTIPDDPAQSVLLFYEGGPGFPYPTVLSVPATGAEQTFDMLAAETPVSFAIRLSVR